MHPGPVAPIVATLLLAGAVLAEEHVNVPAPAERASDPAESLRAPATPETEVAGPRPPSWLTAQEAPALPGEHDGLVWVDVPPPAGAPRTNPVVEAKLELARRAVEASRAAGTLYAAPAEPVRMTDAEKHAAADRRVALPPPVSEEAGVLPRRGE